MGTKQRLRRLKGNRLIAEFMTTEPEVLKKDLQKAGTIESMHYHDDWNWLMPVIHKLWDTPVSPGPLYDKMTNIKDKLNMINKITSAIKHFMLYGGVEQCSWAVIDLIKWYNKHGK